jgi:hypothetical protein
VRYPIASAAFYITSGDFDGDGRRDLAVANDGVSVLLARACIP